MFIHFLIVHASKDSNRLKIIKSSSFIGFVIYFSAMIEQMNDFSVAVSINRLNGDLYISPYDTCFESKELYLL